MFERTILSILQNSPPISDQNEFIKQLHSHGIPATQATLSRKLKKLGIQKIHGSYSLPSSPLPQNSLKSFVTSISLAPPNLLIIKTLPGHAQPIAFKIDSLPHLKNSILGTIAGDDTIFVASHPNLLPSLKDSLLSSL